MSLLLDARKKSQSAISASIEEGRADSGLTLEPLANAVSPSATPSFEDRARNAGKNLFSAKLPPASLSRPYINRSLMYGLGGTVILLMIGGGYVWYAISDTGSNNQPPLPVNRFTPIPAAPSTPIVAAPQNTAAAEVAKEVIATVSTGKVRKKSSAKSTQSPPKNSVRDVASSPPAKPIHVEPQTRELIDPLLNRAYAAYRNGKLDEARQLYLDMLGKDGQNSDALLGLAAIAQQRGEDRIAAQYYLRVLNLDPRNAVANAGMSALGNNENYESRLKTLLREQSNSAALHFALGNLYAEQSRWGEAQQAYFNAYTLDTKNADLAFNLAVSLDHLGQGKLAAQHYQQALQLDQSHNANFDHAKISQRVDKLLR